MKMLGGVSAYTPVNETNLVSKPMRRILEKFQMEILRR